MFHFEHRTPLVFRIGTPRRPESISHHDLYTTPSQDRGDWMPPLELEHDILNERAAHGGLLHSEVAPDEMEAENGKQLLSVKVNAKTETAGGSSPCVKAS